MLGRTLSRIVSGALILAAAGAPAAAAAQTIDRQQTQVVPVALGSNTGPGDGTSNGWLFQQFTPSQATSAGAGILLNPFTDGESGTLTVQLWTDSPAATGATMLATGTTALGSNAGYYDAFWSAVSVTPGNQYFLAFFSPQVYSVDGAYGNGNNTSGGRFNYNLSANVTSPDQGNGFGTSAFHEYSTGPTTTTTPEPSSMALLGTGLIGLVPMIRRRRKA